MADHGTFTGGQAAGLDHDWGSLVVDMGRGFGEGAKSSMSRSGYPDPLHQFFGEGFAALDACGGFGRAEDPEVFCSKAIDDTAG